MKRLMMPLVATAALLAGCSTGVDDCVAFNKTFDDLARTQAAAASKINARGICHTQEESVRREKCPEYYTWVAAATNFANFVASDKSTCTTAADRAAALEDLATLTKPSAFPQK